MAQKINMQLTPTESGQMEPRINLPANMKAGDAALMVVTATSTGQPILEAWDYTEGQRFIVVKVGNS